MKSRISKYCLAIVMLALLAPFLLQVWRDAFLAVLVDPFGMR